MNLSISLLVLRCKDIDVTRRFYEHLGIVFTKEKHQEGPDHYSWENSGFVLGLYPTADGQVPDQVRLGVLDPLPGRHCR
jgi:lactoylglutathione lyase